MAYPVGPPRLMPIASTRNATAIGPICVGVFPSWRIVYTSTKVPITSVVVFHRGLRICGPVEKTASFSPAVSCASKCWR